VSDGPEWFAPKRYGYGAGAPISWQGWVVVLVFLALAFLVTMRFSTRPIIVFAIMVPATTLFLVITAKTTRGGWRWRKGEDD
jgi:hypothetical protein